MGRSLLVLLALVIPVSLAGQIKTTVRFTNDDGSALYKNMANNVGALLTECNVATTENRKPVAPTTIATQEGAEKLRQLWQTASFRCPETTITDNLISLPGGKYQLRNVPLMLLTAQKEQKKQEAVVNFSADGKIEDVFFAIDVHAYKKVMAQGSSLKDFRRRQIILDFLENFRTAYNRRDLEMLQKTFSDNALIIVGRVVVEKENSPEMLLSLGEQRVKLIRYSKQQYLTNLERVFKTAEFLDVRFDDIEIMKHPGYDDIYGVNLKQLWKSKSYGDEGYLFLMIDFENEAQPLVHVRAWQPEKHTLASDIIELGDFDIIK